MRKKELKRVFDEAAAIAADVPEEFRADAFNRAVDALLAEAKPAPAGQAGPRRAPEPQAGSADQVLQRSIEVLQLAAGLLGIEAMTVEQIAAALDRRFGISVSYPRIARALEHSNRLARQAGRGGATIYRLLRPVDAVTLDETEEEPPPAKAKTRSRSAKKKPKARSTQANMSSTVRNLVAAGFFTTAHTAGEVALHLQRTGMDVTGRELSHVLRRFQEEGALHRRKTTKGAYAYQEKQRKKR